MTDEELRYRMERVTERMAGADDTNEVVVSVALMRELFGRLEQMQAKLDAVPVGAIRESHYFCRTCFHPSADLNVMLGFWWEPLTKWLETQVQP